MSRIFSNSVQSINIKDVESIKGNLDANDKVLVVEIDGSNIQSWKDYISEMQSNFLFPTPCFNSIDRYLDWMRDLGWLYKEGFVLIINHFSSFLKNDPELKCQIVSDFVDVILPFWQDEVVKIVVEGKSKSFMVYLVD
jgi:hypothetical protein